jgi:hypothetical protein
MVVQLAEQVEEEVVLVELMVQPAVPQLRAVTQHLEVF